LQYKPNLFYAGFENDQSILAGFKATFSQCTFSWEASYFHEGILQITTGPSMPLVGVTDQPVHHAKRVQCIA
jgi:hypothetical protein